MLLIFKIVIVISQLQKDKIYIYKMEIIEKYKPIIYFHSDEEYFPDSFEAYLENATLWNKDVKLLDKVTPEIISKYRDDQYTLKSENKNGNIERGPIYVRIEDQITYYRLVYFVFFPFNGPLKVFNTFESGEHRADVEKFTIFVNKSDGKIIKIYLGAHGSKDGLWLHEEDFTKEGDKLVIYSALNSHAFYNSEKTYYRYFGVVNDHTNKGFKWSPQVVLLEENGMIPVWQMYQGTLGAPDNCNIFRYRGWENEPEKSTTNWKRFFGCC